MQYICCKDYNKIGASGKLYDIRSGEVLNSIGSFIARDNMAICGTHSEDAFRYFARNDDGLGFERYELTQFIAFSERHPNLNNNFRFSEREIEMLESNYSKFLVPDCDVILFNFDFFNADIDTLKEIKKAVGGEKNVRSSLQR